jgi:transcriptional regulator with XRE-family HTH domain
MGRRYGAGVRRAAKIRLHWTQRRQLYALAESPDSARRVALRAKIALRAAEGRRNAEIAEELAMSPATVALWRRRFIAHGAAGLTRDAPRPGRPPSVPASKVESVIRSSVSDGRADGRRRSVRALARELGLSKSTVQRIRQARQAPARLRSAARPTRGSMDFLERVTDMVGLYVNPPARALAFSTDERLPIAPPGGLDAAQVRPLRPRSQGVELRAFLQRMDGETPRILDVHLLVDARLMPVPAEVENWLSRHPRFHLHFLPPEPSGFTVIDRLIDGFSRRRDRPGASASAHRLKYALQDHLQRDRDPLAAFVWTAASGEIRGAYGRRDLDA